MFLFTSMFCSLSVSLPSLLFKNRQIFKRRWRRRRRERRRRRRGGGGERRRGRRRRRIIRRWQLSSEILRLDKRKVQSIVAFGSFTLKVPERASQEAKNVLYFDLDGDCRRERDFKITSMNKTKPQTYYIIHFVFSIAQKLSTLYFPFTVFLSV